MGIYTEKSQDNKVRSETAQALKAGVRKAPTAQFQDNRPAGVAQRLQQKNSLQLKQLPHMPSGPVQKPADQKPPLQKKENKTGLPDALKSGMENLSGHSLDHVNVHYNSPKPAAVQAHAYAQGANIHLGRGQEKHLPHELGHVVQQMNGQVKATTRVGGVAVNDNPGLESEASAMGEKALQRVVQRESPKAGAVLGGHSPLIQRVEKNVLITGISHLVTMKKGTIYGGIEEREIIQGQLLVIDSDAKKLSRRGPNQEEPENHEADETGPQHYEWFKVLSVDGTAAPKNLYVREDVFVTMKAEKGTSKLDQLSDFVDGVTEFPSKLIGNEGVSGLADVLNDKTVKTNTGGGPDASDRAKQHASNMGVVGDSITGVTGLIGLVKGFKDLGDPEARAADLFETAMKIEQGAMKTGESVSKLVHTSQNSSTPTTASKFGSTFEGYGAAFGAIHEGFVGMRKLVKLVNERQDYSSSEKAAKSAEVGAHVLESAKNIVLSVKSFIELVNGAASGGLMSAVPGLGIAVSAAKLIMDGYYLAKSNTNRKLMNERRKAIQGNTDMGDASEFYRKTDAEIANRKEVIKDDQKRVDDPKTGSKDKTRLKKRIKKLNDEIIVLQSEESDDGLSRDNVSEYTMATELRDANTKRVKRQSVHIGAEFTKIAGEIAILTGVGALGGVITKGAATAVDSSLPAVRAAKQAGRDRAARKIVKEKMKKSKFDHTRSTAAKADFRLKQVQNMIRMIVDLDYRKLDAKSSEVKVVKDYLQVSGVDTKKLFKKNGDPQTQIKMLLDAIQTREF